MTGTELTAEQIEEAKKKEEEARSLQKEEKATSPTLTSPPKDQLTDAQKLKIFELQTKTVRDQGASLARLKKDFDELKAKKEEENQPTLDERSKGFYADPVKIIREELQKAIAPLNEFKNRFESDSEYDRIKKGLKANPVFAEHLSNPQFESVVDQLIAEGQRTGVQLNENIVIATIKHTIGDVVTGELVLDIPKKTGNETGNENKKEEERMIPPYLAPSSPPQKTRGTEKQYRDLTENEDRLRRERGMTKEQYLNWLEVDSNDVIDSKIGIKAEEKK